MYSDCRTDSIAAGSKGSCCMLCAQPMQTTGVSCQAQPKYIMQNALLVPPTTISYGVAGSCKASWLKLMVMPRYDVRLCSPMRSVCHHDMMMLWCCSGRWNRHAATHSCCIDCSLEASFVRRHTQLYCVDGAVSIYLQSLLLLLLLFLYIAVKHAALRLARTVLLTLTVCAGDAAAARQKSDKAETPGDCSAQGKQHH